MKDEISKALTAAKEQQRSKCFHQSLLALKQRNDDLCGDLNKYKPPVTNIIFVVSTRRIRRKIASQQKGNTS
jgi:hypothetical protein